jgi:hypothetical protein
MKIEINGDDKEIINKEADAIIAFYSVFPADSFKLFASEESYPYIKITEEGGEVTIKRNRNFERTINKT